MLARKKELETIKNVRNFKETVDGKKVLNLSFALMSEEASSILYVDPTIVESPIKIAKIHPLVIFQIMDAYQRRCIKGNEAATSDTDKAVGLLFGETVNGCVSILDCYTLAFDEKGNVDKQIRNQMFQEHRELYPNEDVVGWWTFSENRYDYPDVISKGYSAVHIWLRPSVPPTIDAFCVTKLMADDTIVSAPIPYRVDATVDEQLGLSRLADAKACGSLQAANNELVSLLTAVKGIISRPNCSKLIARDCHAALALTHLDAEEKKTLEESQEQIKSFIEILHNVDVQVQKAEDYFSVPLE